MNSINLEEFGKRIIKLREKSGKSQDEICTELGVTQQTLSRYEKGQRQASLDFVFKASKYFNVSADYLLGLSKIQSTDKKIETACEVTGLSEKAINKIISFCSFTAEDDITDRLYTELDADFFAKHNISRTAIINDVVEKILPMTCFNILEIFSLISKYCYDIEHTRNPLEQTLEYYDVFENCESEEEKQRIIDFLSKANLPDYDKINYTFELENKIKHGIYDCADYFKFGLSDYISHVCKGIESFKYEGLLNQYKFTAEYAHAHYVFDTKEDTDNAHNNPEEE